MADAKSKAAAETNDDRSPVLWHPEPVPLDDFFRATDDDMRRLAIDHVTGDVEYIEGHPSSHYLIASPGPVLQGVVFFDGPEPQFLRADATVNWVTLGADQRLTDVWANWNSGALLTPTQVQAIADACNRRGAQELADFLYPFGDDSLPDDVTASLLNHGAHESAVVTLRTARARAAGYGNQTVTREDIVLGLFSSLHTDPVSLALRRLANPEWLAAYDTQSWSHDINPKPGTFMDLEADDLLARANQVDPSGVRNASLLAAIFSTTGPDNAWISPEAFEADLTIPALHDAILAQKDVFAEEGIPDLKQIDFFAQAYAKATNQPVPVSSAQNIASDTSQVSGTSQDSVIRASLGIPPTRIDLPGDEDFLDVEQDAAAFARLIAYKETRLPLSIGIFGHWGSGKTFFMNTVEREIAKLEGTDYHHRDKIAVIPFNAWHYMETNIWASLVSVIFKGLLSAQSDAEHKDNTVNMFEALAVAQDSQLDALQAVINRYKKADAAQDDVVQAIENAHENGAGFLQIAKAIYGRMVTSRKADVEKLKTVLEDDEKFRTVGEIKSRRAQLAGIERDENIFALLDASEEAIASGRMLRNKMKKVFWSPWLLAPLALATLASPFLFRELAEYLGRPNFQTSDLAPVLATLSTAATGAAVWIRRTANAATKAFEDLEQAVKDDPDTKKADSIRNAELLNVKAAQKRLDDREAQADAAYQRLLNGSILGRLSNLIKDRAEGDTYNQHLSIIATIRSDFENLSNMLLQSEARGKEAKNWEAHKKKALARLTEIKTSANDLIEKDRSRAARIERLNTEAIARDIDPISAPLPVPPRAGPPIELTNYGKQTEDLISDAIAKIEAYTPTNNIERVVLLIDDLDRCPPRKVYEVLQAVHLFLSFPLFVAMVGVDTRWMETSLKSQLQDLVNGESGATPRDYLEKIFQIPYWTKPLEPKNAENFVTALLGAVKKRAESAPQAPAQTVPPTPQDATVQPEANTQPTPTTEPSTAPTPQPEPDPKPPEPPAEFVAPSAEEQAFLVSISQFSGTSPRRLIRFLNIFMLIKSLPSPGAAPDLTTQKAIMTQLALCVGTPELAGAYYDVLDDAEPHQTMATFMAALDTRLEDDGTDEDQRDRVKSLFDIYEKPEHGGTVAHLIQTAEISRKFTFASPEAKTMASTGGSEPPPTGPNGSSS